MTDKQGRITLPIADPSCADEYRLAREYVIRRKIRRDRQERYKKQVQRALENAADTEPEIPDTNANEGWPAATTLKYIATVQAHEGKTEEAKSTFDRACRILKNTPTPLLKLIHGTILLQAGTSLRATHPNDAQNYLDQAKDIFSSSEMKSLISPNSAVSAQHWLKHTINVIDSTIIDDEQGKSPQLKFLY